MLTYPWPNAWVAGMSSPFSKFGAVRRLAGKSMAGETSRGPTVIPITSSLSGTQSPFVGSSVSAAVG